MITTDRLILRRWQDSDRPPFAAMGTDPVVMQYFPAPMSRAESDALIDRVNAHIDQRGFGVWAMEHRETGQFLGFTGLMLVNIPSPIENDIEIGWRLPVAAWGQGYAREAASASLEWAWANLAARRIVAMTVAANTRSWGLMLRLGLSRRPDLDFDHPRLAIGHVLRPHIVHAIDRQ